MFETTVTLVGNLLSTPRVRETRQGNRITSFRMVSTARRFDRADQKWVNGDRVNVTVHCWRRLAKAVVESLTQHDPVVVTGRLRTREYEVEGRRRTVAEVEAIAIGRDLLGEAAAKVADLEASDVDASVSRPYQLAMTEVSAASERAVGA